MNTQILSGSDDAHLDLFVCTLRAGQPIAVPTETVYGLAAPVDDEAALQRIFEIKERPLKDPLILHIADPSWITDWAKGVDVESFTKLSDAFWPGPLTIVLPKNERVPDLATANLPTAGFRMPRHPDFLDILKALGTPLAAPSANPFTYISPTRAEHVFKTLDGKIPYIVDGGPCEEGIESTILDLTHPDQPKILRPGPISAQEISNVLNREISMASRHATPDISHRAPGNFEKHYAPRKPIATINTTQTEGEFEETDALIFCRAPQGANKGSPSNRFYLGDPTDIRAIRRNLYHTLNSLDADTTFKRIILVDWPDTFHDPGLDDRVRRALSKG